MSIPTTPHRPINPTLTSILNHFYSMFEYPGPYLQTNNQLSPPYPTNIIEPVSARLANIVIEEYLQGYRVVGLKSWVDPKGQEWVQAVRG